MSEKSRYMDYLPALFAEHPFLGKFLLPFENKLDELTSILDGIGRYFDPYLTDPEFLPWLASWVALTMDPEWQEDKQRELIAKALDLYRRRGTVGGLKQYLKIYTGMEPEIREWHWPGGMQIGVASRIGGLSWDGAPEDPSIFDFGNIRSVSRYAPLRYDDYYVVTLNDDPAPVSCPVSLPDGPPCTFYYSADPAVVSRVDVGDEDGQPYVALTMTESGEVLRFSPATVTRRDHLIDDGYPLVQEPPDEGVPLSGGYSGDTFLIDELAGEDYFPYRFIVDVKIPPGEKEYVKMDKIRAIVDLEKPAHTVYYLKLTYVESRQLLEPMQIEVRSSIGTNTVIGPDMKS